MESDKILIFICHKSHSQVCSAINLLFPEGSQLTKMIGGHFVFLFGVPWSLSKPESYVPSPFLLYMLPYKLYDSVKGFKNTIKKAPKKDPLKVPKSSSNSLYL